MRGCACDRRGPVRARCPPPLGGQSARSDFPMNRRGAASRCVTADNTIGNKEGGFLFWSESSVTFGPGDAVASRPYRPFRAQPHLRTATSCNAHVARKQTQTTLPRARGRLHLCIPPACAHLRLRASRISFFSVCYVLNLAGPTGRCTPPTGISPMPSRSGL